MRNDFKNYLYYFADASLSSLKYDPELLKSEVDLSRKRVDRLRTELAQIEVQMKYKQMGVDSLAQLVNMF